MINAIQTVYVEQHSFKAEDQIHLCYQPKHQRLYKVQSDHRRT